MPSPRATRSSNNLANTPLQHLVLPPRHRGGAGRSTSPLAPRCPGAVQAFFAYREGASATTAPTPDESVENFEDAPGDTSPNTSSTMASTLIQAPGLDASNEELRRYAETLREQALAFSNSLATTTQLLHQSLTNSSTASSSGVGAAYRFSGSCSSWPARKEPGGVQQSSSHSAAGAGFDSRSYAGHLELLLRSTNSRAGASFAKDS